MEYSRFLKSANTRYRQQVWGETKELSRSSRVSDQKLSRVLTDSHIAGAVVSGPLGSGRRALVEICLKKSANPPQLIRLNGSNFGTKVPLGALSFLLAQLDVSTYSSRHELIHALGRVLYKERRPSIVMLGRPELIDEQSSSLLAQLATMGKIKLIVICENVQDLPGDLFALYRSGRFEHHRVHRMSRVETHHFLESELGGRASVLTSATLCYFASGNRELMHKLIQCWREDGQLLQRNGTWVLHMIGVGSGPSMQALHTSWTNGLSIDEKELLAALALGGPVTLERIHRTGLTAQLDGLLNRGQVKYLSGSTDRVGLYNPLLAVLMRVDAKDRHTAGRESLLTELHPDPSAAKILAELQSLNDIGDYSTQVQVAERFQLTGFEPEGWRASPEVRVSIVEIHAKALVMLGQESVANGAIHDARRGLVTAIHEAGHLDSLDVAFQELELLTQFVTLSNVEMSNEASVIGNSEELVKSSTWMSESLHLRALSIQALGWASQTRQADAMKLVRYIDNELRNMRMSSPLLSNFEPEDAADIEFQLLQSELLAGCWKLAASRAQKLASGHYQNPLLTSHADIVHGILLGLNNDHDAALRVLEPALPQLRLSGGDGLVSIVSSVIAYSLASSGRRLEASAFIIQEPENIETSPVPLNFYTWSGEIFSALALAELGSVNVASARLKAFATRVRDEGHTVLEALTLAFVVRLSGNEALRDLERASQLCQGYLGQKLVQLAHAASNDEPHQLGVVLNELTAIGNVLIAVPAQNALFNMLEPKAQRKLNRTINEIRRSAIPTDQNENEILVDKKLQQPGWLRELTKRETQIAKLAIEGKSNSEIAKFNGVSIRTVEGHLYQVYSKLQVRNRQELTALDRSSRRTAGLR